MTAIDKNQLSPTPAPQSPFTPTSTIPRSTVQAAIEYVYAWFAALVPSVGAAPKDAVYIVQTADSTLTAERVATDTATVAWDFATAAQAKANVPDDAITFAKMQNIATDRLIGRDTASSGNPEEISVGGGVEFSGSTGIQRSALTGDVTASAGSNATALANGVVKANHLATSTPAFGLTAPINLGLAVSAAASALTIALKGVDGTDPSSTNPVVVPFRSPTAATGTPVVRSQTAAMSLVLSSGSTLGAATGRLRIWIVLFDDAGTLRLGAINCSTSTQIYTLTEALASSTAEGAAGAADTAGVFYTTTAVSTKAYRVIGYAEWTSSMTAGAWTAPEIVQLYGPGVKKPGDVVQSLYGQTTSVTTVTTSTFTATASSLSITPTSAANLVRVAVSGALSAANASDLGWARAYRDAVAIGPLGGAYIGGVITETVTTLNLLTVDYPQTVSATTYALRIANSLGSANVSWPPNSGYAASILVEEIMG